MAPISCQRRSYKFFSISAPLWCGCNYGEIPMSLSVSTCKNSAWENVKKGAQWLGATMAVFLVCLPLFAQTNQSTIQGALLDQTGGAIAGATVTVIDVARGVTRALVTDGAGQYVANNLTPGTYTVRAEAKGFRTVEHSGVLVEVGQSIRVDLVVQPGEQTQTIRHRGGSGDRYHRCYLGRHRQQTTRLIHCP